MKIFINSHNRADVITTPALLDACDIPYQIVLHDNQQAFLYAKYSDKLIVANQPFGLVNMRNWILENLVEDDEWYLILDDNITKFTAVPEPYYSYKDLPVKEQPAQFKDLFEREISALEFIDICEESIALAEKTGAKLIGFASNVNFFFRAKKWREVGYVIGKTQLIKKTDLRYDLNVVMTDDYLWTAQNLERFGKVLINNYCVALKKHYMKGGIGQYDARLKWKLPEVQYMMRRFPGLFRYKIKKGHDPKSEIVVAFTSLEQVKKWRLSIAESGGLGR